MQLTVTLNPLKDASVCPFNFSPTIEVSQPVDTAIFWGELI